MRLLGLALLLWTPPAQAGWMQDVQSQANQVQKKAGDVQKRAENLAGKEPSDDEINAEAAKVYADVKASYPISNRDDWNAIVQRVAKRIEVASGTKYAWEAVLLESPEVNAWCLPGGKIAVYTGIMPVLKNEAALAAVLGHEVAHATLKHGKKKVARAMRQDTMNRALGSAGNLCDSESCRAMAKSGNDVAKFGMTFFSLKYSRGDESSADRWGQYFMAKAGYDPAESIRLWERMSAASRGKAPPEWMSTHPSDANRKSALQGWLRGSQVWYQKAPKKYSLGEKIK